MKKLLTLIIMLGFITISYGQSKKKILSESIEYVVEVDQFNLYFYDTEQRMEVHQTMAKLDADHNPNITIVKDAKLGVWKIATSFQESNTMADEMNAVSVKYKDILLSTRKR